MPPTPTADAGDLIGRLYGARVLVVGDAMLDRAVHGRVMRISPEAPIPILEAGNEEAMPGGAANVAANLAALGAHVSLVALAGDDPAGRQLGELLVPVVHGRLALLRELGRPTTVKTRYVAAGQQLLRVDRESRDPLGGSVGGELLEVARRTLADVDVLVLSDYAKGVLTGTLAPELIAAARALGRPVLVDPKGRAWQRYHGATLLTPNRTELGEAAGLILNDAARLESAAGSIRESFACDALLVTLGADGMLLVRADSPPLRIPGIPREVFDVVGAGDTVLAVLAASLAGGLTIEDAARLANVAGSLAVTREGTATIGAADLRTALAEDSGAGHLTKVIDRRAAELVVADERRKGHRIGFTNGCFDLLHPGHVSLIEQARARCDFLVVGLNSDDSVRRLKGPTRPVNGTASRAAVLAALGGVDAVVVFDEDTPVELIRALRPDLLVKGADYTVEQVVGGDLVQSWGGEVFLAALTPDTSTTRTLERIGRAG